MEIIKLSEIEFEKNAKNVLFKIVHKNENVTITNIKLNTDEKVPPHKVPVDVFFYIIKGSGKITIGEETKDVTANEIIICPPNTMMSLWADKGEEFVFINVKTPSLK